MNSNDIGISTASGHDFLPLEKRLELLKQAEFKSVMLWWGEFDEYQSRKERIKLAQKHKLEIENVHADMANSNALWLDGSQGDEKLNELIKAVNDCKIYDIKRMVIHLTNGNNPPSVSQQGLQRLERLFEYAIKSEVVLAIENVRRDEHIRYVFDNYKNKHIAFCYDSGHANLWCRSIDWLTLYGDRLAAIHLHDNNGMHDSHNIPFFGTVNWDKILRQIKNSSYQGTLTLESEYQGDNDTINLYNFMTQSYKSGLQIKLMLNY